MKNRNIFSKFVRICREFLRRKDGNIVPVFAFAAVPVIGLIGSTIDYSRGTAERTSMQAVLDAAVLAAAANGTSQWRTNAEGVIASKYPAWKNDQALTLTLEQNKTDVYTGSITKVMPTVFSSVFGKDTVSVSVKSTAAVTAADDSCILTLDKGQPLSHVSLSLNGAPIINLSNCSIRSNTSLDCNGHDGSTPKAIAAGASDGCQRPKAYADVVPDIYTDMAKYITTECGTARPGVTWEAGVIPTGPGVRKVVRDTYTEYHICGDLTLTGTGLLTGAVPSSDIVIIIENGTLTVLRDAAVSTKRTAIVMTGNNSYSAAVIFPTGNGQSASLTLSPPTDPANPWQAVAIYQDPKLTRNLDSRWGPGATFSADGLVYLGNTNVVTDGNTTSSNSKCSKFVMNSFTTNGSVALDFAQVNCASIGLKQWGGRPVRLIN